MISKRLVPLVQPRVGRSGCWGQAHREERTTLAVGGEILTVLWLIIDTISLACSAFTLAWPTWATPTPSRPIIAECVTGVK